MSDDLISRSELKKAIYTYDKFACFPDGRLYPVRELKHPEMFVNYIHFEDVIKAIDNALTVAQPDFKEGYKQAIIDGKTNYSRQKGEWLDYSNEGYVECPFCGSATNCEDNIKELHYCFNCGARMKGGAE